VSQSGDRRPPVPQARSGGQSPDGIRYPGPEGPAAHRSACAARSLFVSEGLEDHPGYGRVGQRPAEAEQRHPGRAEAPASPGPKRRSHRARAGFRGLRRAFGLLLEAWLPSWALRSGALDDQRLGRLGEALAERYLARRGLVPLARRARVAGVEVDLLLRQGPRLVLAEVKCSAVARDQRLEELWRPPGWRLDPARWQRLGRAARRLAGPREPAARIDLVEVLVHGPGRRVEVRWWPDRRGPLLREELGLGPPPIRGSRPGPRGPSPPGGERQP
jgi:putative endonuclease